MSTVAEAVPAGEVPTSEPPAEAAPAGEVPSSEPPAEAVPAGEVPSSEPPAEAVPAGEVPSSEPPAEAAPAGEVPSSEPPAEAAPAGEVPSSEPPAETPTEDAGGGDAKIVEGVVEVAKNVVEKMEDVIENVTELKLLMGEAEGPQVVMLYCGLFFLPNKLHLVKCDPADLGAMEVQVKVSAGGVTGLEKQGCRKAVAGQTAAGVVADVGSDVIDRKKGDEVMVYSQGAWQEMLNVPVSHTYLKPSTLSLQEAAILPVNYATAYLALHDLGGLKKDDTVFILSGASCVGLAAVQLSLAVSGVTVIATAPSSHHQQLRDAGVMHLIDPQKCDYTKEVMKVSSTGVNIIIDPQDVVEMKKCLPLLKTFGKLIIIDGNGPCPVLKGSIGLKLACLFNSFKSVSLENMQDNRVVARVNVGKLGPEFPVMQETIGKIIQLCEDNKIHPLLGSSFPFNEASEAVEYLEKQKGLGTPIITPLTDVIPIMTP
uniref:synaptic vesicle membrane protein VAT-1 homolog n=1 Tax=Myxine glutinosa TaxID=7769 RepID=UPI00358DE17E